MLVSLQIKNIAIINEISVNFENGFNALTGETGAGKSILIDSINMVLGERTSRDLIRHGEQKAYVAALFYINNPAVISSLNTLGIQPDEEGSLLITREIHTDGRSVCKINDNIVNTALVREASKLLIDLHGQHDSQALLSKPKHIEFLDSFSGDKLTALKTEYTEKYKELKSLKSEIERIQTDETEKQAKLDLLRFQIDEINSANLSMGEDTELSAKLSVYKNMQKIIEGARAAYTAINGGGGHSLSATDSLNTALSALSKIAVYSDELSAFSDRLADISVNLEEFARDFKPYMDDLSMNEQELEYTQARLDLIFRLKRKYGETIEDILAFYDNAVKEYDAIYFMEETLTNLKVKYDKLLSELNVLSQTLSEIRCHNAEKLSELITQELRGLNMASAVFKVSVIKTEAFKENGTDDVEFLITANAGEPPKPLSKIASGGELSRVMLSIKSILSSYDLIDTMIFDEIDTGVSGDTANKIALLIAKISKTRQILCITHLAQLAAMADAHYLISKSETQGKTTTKVSYLSQNQRAEQLSKITGLSEITAASLLHANELLSQAQKHKDAL